MSSSWDGGDDEERAPICPSCGVTALACEAGDGFVCENADCAAFGERVIDG